MARAKLTVDLTAIRRNWRALDALSASDTETAAVLKANSYGLGITRTAPALAAEGAKTFFVALADEGAELREILGIKPKIYILSGLLPGDEKLCRDYDLTPCLNSIDQIRRMAAAIPGHTSALQIDSGMNRLGLEPADLTEATDHIAKIRADLLLSHLACADEPSHPQNRSQLQVFKTVARDFPDLRRSLAATGGILLGCDFHHNLTRPGIGLFGGAPFSDGIPVVSLSLPVIQVREVEEGEAVGYGANWTAPETRQIATISAGYADGLLRTAGNGQVSLYAGDTPCPMVGRISMDLITVDVTGLETVPSHLEILNEHQTVDDLANAAGTIGYEFLTSLGDRYERNYKESQQ